MILTSFINKLFFSLSLKTPFLINRVRQGQSTIVFFIITENGSKYYLRIPKNKEESVIPEVLIHKKLYKLGIKIPSIITYQDACVFLNGHSFILLDAIHGSPCTFFYAR
ncbi:hypothetical protein KJ671_02455 [Patescibacteria group bacterium]|nr:hypothetical protein [Patescibacteria group bacterium]